MKLELMNTTRSHVLRVERGSEFLRVVSRLSDSHAQNVKLESGLLSDYLFCATKRNAVCPNGPFTGLIPPLEVSPHCLSINSPAHSTTKPASSQDFQQSLELGSCRCITCKSTAECKFRCACCNCRRMHRHVQDNGIEFFIRNYIFNHTFQVSMFWETREAFACPLQVGQTYACMFISWLCSNQVASFS